MSTNNTRISPVIDSQTLGFNIYENQINNDATNQHITGQGNATCSYVSKTVTLDDGLDAEDLRVYVTAFKPGKDNCNIKVYGKILNEEDNNTFYDRHWTELDLIGPDHFSNDDNRLDYITGEYLNTNLTPDQKEQYQDYRENVEQAINPMAKPSNIAIGIGLNQLIPGAGYLFGHYKQSTAMGYGMTNPLNGLTDKFGNAKDWVADKFGGLLDGSTGNFNTSTVGQGDNDRTTMNTLAPLAPYAVSETTPDVSQANKWYNSIGENTESTFNFAQAYADAKTKVTNNLRSHGPLAQLAVSDSPYYDWLKVNKIDKGIL